MIQVQGLTKYYGSHRAIEDLSFDAEKGEILGFLGPNGAGKTTTMRILTGYMPPTAGRVEIAGFDVVDESLEARKRIGYLPETVPLYPELTIHEYLTFMGRLRGVEDLEGRIATVLGDVHLTERSEQFIGNLSKGLRQRAGLAQAMLHQPELLILDEPTIGLDPAQIIEVRELIQSLGREHTVLLSTHILSEAQQVCDRVLIINQGRIVAEDSPENLGAQLTGADRLFVRVGGDTSELLARIKALSGVRDASETDTVGQIQVLTDPGREVRAEVARTVVGAGVDLLELRAAGYSLEEVFLQLTSEREAEQ
jgi:ABC-2 type transport system ATP-binding protein